MFSFDLSKKVVEKILIKARRHQNVFEQEQAKAHKISDQYDQLIDKFGHHAQSESIEGFSPWIYLDAPGAYLTVGYGHLIYKRPFKISPPLDIQRIKLPSFSLKDIDEPFDMFKGITIEPDMILEMFNSKHICLGLLDALSIDFEWGNLYLDGKMPKVRSTESIRGNLRDDVIVGYYSIMVALSLLMNKRSQERGHRWSNLFQYWCFAMLSKKAVIEKLPIVTEDSGRLLFKRDVAKKVYELILPIDRNTPSFPKFSSYPLNAQLALLDLAYNTGVATLVLDKEFYPLVTSENWQALGKLNKYPKRSDRSFAKRNSIVKNWFLNAKSSNQLQASNK